MPETIYHYTSIESLALILSTRKLRFTRLDRVDDVKEAQVSEGVEFGKYFFISCWTEESRESIPQWNMYSKDMEGVRIALPPYPFAKKDISTLPPRMHMTGKSEPLSPFTWDEMSGPDYLIVPMFLKNDFFAGPVEYIDDIAARYAETVRREIGPNGRERLNVGGLPQLTRIKERDWEFQKEFRFSLFIVPVPEVPATMNNLDAFVHRFDDIPHAVLSGRELKMNYVDVDLGDESFETMIVRTGPHCPPGGRIVVEALLEKYAPNAVLEESNLAGAIRRRA